MQDQILFFQSLRKTPAVTATEGLLTTAEGMERSLTKLLLFCFSSRFLFLFTPILYATKGPSIPVWLLVQTMSSLRLCKHTQVISEFIPPQHDRPRTAQCSHSNELGCSTSAGQGLHKPALFCMVHYRCILKPPVNTLNNRMRLFIVHSQMVIQTFTYLLGILIISTE